MKVLLHLSRGKPVRDGLVGLGRTGWNIHVQQIEPQCVARVVEVAVQRHGAAISGYRVAA